MNLAKRAKALLRLLYKCYIELYLYAQLVENTTVGLIQ